MCAILAAVNSGPVQTGRRKSLGQPLKRSVVARKGWGATGCDLSVRLSIHSTCAVRKKVELRVE
jgi:hypothetical protein